MNRLGARVKKLEKRRGANIGKKWTVPIFVEVGETRREAITRHLVAHPEDSGGPFMIATHETLRY